MVYGTLKGAAKLTLLFSGLGLITSVADFILNIGYEIFSIAKALLHLNFDFWNTLIELNDTAFSNFIYKISSRAFED